MKFIKQSKEKADKSGKIEPQKNESVAQKVADDKLLNFKTLEIDGTTYYTNFNAKYENRKKWAKANPNHIISVIPGTITKMMIADGQKVEKDFPMLILEAMKMENTIFAPHTGTIKKVHVKISERVPKGQLLVEFEE